MGSLPPKEGRFVTCTARGVQPYITRLRESAVLAKYKPRLHRCEVTGLSRSCNLYFVSCGGVILVHQPIFPYQELGSPALIVAVPISGLGSGGYIDRLRPHDINRLHVAYLGHKEIVLVACDDGDVVGFYVSAIQMALDEQASSVDEKAKGKPTAVPIFFHINVRSSAWGLAVHREARTIAISANSHKVAVVQFHLTSSKSPLPMTGPYSTKIFHSGSNNIPFLAFNNNGTDPAGRWLLGGDIDGNTFLWDLADPAGLARRIQVGRCPHFHFTPDAANELKASCQCGVGEFQHGMWGGVFIDERTCHQSISIDEALGGMGGGSSRCQFWDISHLRVRRWPPRFDYQQGQDTFGPSGPPSTWIESMVGGNVMVGLEVWGNDAAIGDADEEEEEEEEDMFEEPDFGPAFAPSPPHIPAPTPPAAPFHAPQPGITMHLIMGLPTTPASADIDAAKAQPSLQKVSAEVDTSNRQYCFVKRSEKGSDIATPPIALISKDDVFLLQSSSGPDDSVHPVVSIERALYYADCPSRPVPGVPKRLTLSHYIAELGVLLVGSTESQSCAVLSLTQMQMQHRTASGKTGTIYGFRHELLLPFPEEPAPTGAEYYNTNHLVGIAAAPIQGQLDSDGGERRCDTTLWRIFLYFCSHTVYTYEIYVSRPPGEMSLSKMTV